MTLGFNEENWEDCLGLLGFFEKPNPNGRDCFDVYDDDGIPRWQYEGEEKKEKLYYFFYGILYGRLHKPGKTGGRCG